MQTFICLAFLLCILAFEVTGQSNSSDSVTVSNNQTTAVQASLQQQSDAMMEFCETSCFMEALSENQTQTLPAFCSRLCPDYIIPDEYLNPDAECIICPAATCQRCRCDTGECLDDTTVLAESPLETENTSSENVTIAVAGTGSGDAAVGGNGTESNITRALIAGAGPVGGTPVVAQYCASCHPRRRCFPFWHCRNK